jgi:hypothetical protein
MLKSSLHFGDVGFMLQGIGRHSRKQDLNTPAAEDLD